MNQTPSDPVVVISTATIIHTIQLSTKSMLDNWMVSHRDILPDIDQPERRGRILEFGEAINDLIEGNKDSIRQLFHDGYTFALTGSLMSVLEKIKGNKQLLRLEIVTMSGKTFYVNDEDVQW